MKTDGQGELPLPPGAPAPYQLTIAAPGFETVKRETLCCKSASATLM